MRTTRYRINRVFYFFWRDVWPLFSRLKWHDNGRRIYMFIDFSVRTFTTVAQLRFSRFGMIHFVRPNILSYKRTRFEVSTIWTFYFNFFHKSHTIIYHSFFRRSMFSDRLIIKRTKTADLSCYANVITMERKHIRVTACKSFKFPVENVFFFFINYITTTIITSVICYSLSKYSLSITCFVVD